MEKVEPRKRGSLAVKLLRLFKASRGLQEKNVSVGIPETSYYAHPKGIKTALLEAERKKAEAIEWQKRRFIC